MANALSTRLNTMPNIFYTVCDESYLPKAKVLGDSIKSVYPDSSFILVLADQYCEYLTEVNCVDFVYSFQDFGKFGISTEYFFDKNIVEICTFAKPYITKYLVLRNPNDNVIYLDPDCILLEKLDEAELLLESNFFVVTPHINSSIDLSQFSQEQLEIYMKTSELSSLIHGTFNLGFFICKLSPGLTNFLDWWIERVTYDCNSDNLNGVFTDQKWINLASSIFDSIGILNHPGYNVSSWNFLNPKLCDISVFRFFHYSGFDNGWYFKLMNILKPAEAVSSHFLHYTNLILESTNYFYRLQPEKSMIRLDLNMSTPVDLSISTPENSGRQKLLLKFKNLTLSKLIAISTLFLQMIFALTFNFNRLSFVSTPELKFFNLSPYTYAWGMYSVIPNYTSNVTIEFKNSPSLLVNAENLIGKVSGNMMYSKSERLKLCSIYTEATAVIYSMEPLENRSTQCP